MTDHLTISRKLALAIGWKPEQMRFYDGELWIERRHRLHGLLRPFDYRNELIAFRVAERFDAFPTKLYDGTKWVNRAYGAPRPKDVAAATPQLAIALAVIAAQGVK